MWRRTATISIVAAFVAGYAADTFAQDSPWQVRVGNTSVRPKSNNSSIVNVDDNSSLTFTVSYYFNDNWAFEILAAVPSVRARYRAIGRHDCRRHRASAADVFDSISFSAERSLSALCRYWYQLHDVHVGVDDRPARWFGFESRRLDRARDSARRRFHDQ